MEFKELPKYKHYIDGAIIRKELRDGMDVIFSRALEDAQKDAYNAALRFAANNVKLLYVSDDEDYLEQGTWVVSKASILKHIIK